MRTGVTDHKVVLLIDIKSCPRCTASHGSMPFFALSRQISCGNETLTHWAACPDGGEPVLIKVVR